MDTADDETGELDAREIDGEPLSEIMAVLKTLPEDGTLGLTYSFEFEPLYTMLEQRGFVYETPRASDDE